MLKVNLLVLFVLVFNFLNSQIVDDKNPRKTIIENKQIIGQAQKSVLKSENCLGVTNLRSSDLNWLPTIILKRHKPENENNELIEGIKK